MRHDQHDDDPTIEDHDRGLQFDLPKLISRRRAVTVFAGSIGSLALAACGSSSDGGSGAAATTPTTSATTSGDATTEIPEETGGPFPGDGSNGPNVLAESGVVRSDITKSIGDLSGTAGGVPTTIEMTLLDVAGGGKPLAGAAVYIWHCDREGRYSMYDSEIGDENYLRGVQAADADGKLTFTSIFPGAYSGRWPHIHFEVYRTAADAQKATGKLRTSQIALPEDASKLVYATSGYEQSVQNLSQTSLDSDMVFSDGYSLQMATVTGNVDDGMTIKLNVAV
jgi:protocatechuate 3,4-dioxygenase beta subunit